MIYSQEFELGSRTYKSHNGRWFLYSSGEKKDQIYPYCLTVRLKDKSKPDVSDFSKLDISGITVSQKKYPGDYYFVNINKDKDPFSIAKKLYESDTFEYVEFDAYIEFCSIPNDEYYDSDQWNLKSDRLNMPRAWDITTGNSSIILAIIDLGVYVNHEDLDGNIWNNTAEIEGQEDVDDDENGYVDDYHGWHFGGSNWEAGNEEKRGDNILTDTGGGSHGTSIAGITIAQTNNYENGDYIGIAGIAGGWGNSKGVQGMVLKCYEDQSWDYEEQVTRKSSVMDCIQYALDNGARVINMSFEFRHDFSDFEDLIDEGVDDYDCIFVASSGNDGLDEIDYPALYTNVIAVGSVDSQDRHALYEISPGVYDGSNWGDELDVVAPEAVKTTAIPNDYYHTFLGTSAAAAHVSALAALILSINSNLNPSEVKNIIIESADEDIYDRDGDPIEYDEEGHSTLVGYGRINAYEALKYTLENHGGTIGGDGKTVTFHEDITVKSGKTLTIADGTTVEFKPDKKLTIKGTLNAEDVNFESTSGIAEWGGLVFDGSSCSSSKLDECTIEDAIVGITITGSNASPTIEKCLVQDCDSYPLKLTSDCTPNIYNNKFHAGNTHAVYISSADGDFNDNEFRTSSGTTYGVYVTGSSSNPDFDAKEGISGNLFDLSYIASHGAYTAGGYPEFGDSGPHDGLNDFINRGSSKYIYNNTGSTVDAEVNYWGGTPQSSWFSGSVDYNPYESSSNDAGPTWKVLSNPYFVGSDMYEDGEYEDALTELKSALQNDTESAKASSAVFKMAKSALKLNRLDSEESFLKNLLSSPNSEVRHMSRVWLAYLYAMQDQIEEAEKIAFQAPEGTRAQRAELLSLVSYHNAVGDEESAERIAGLLREKHKDEYLAFDLEAAMETMHNFSKSLAKSKAELPKSFTLKNYPNPFNPSTTLKYNIPNTSDIKMEIYNTLGQKIKSYSITSQEPGTHQLTWHGKNNNGWDVPSGIYFVRFRATSLDNKKDVFEKSLKITLIR